MEYANRDAEELGEHYLRHVAAMTAEKLHSKSAIAAELAHRDKRITELESAISLPGEREKAGGHVIQMARRSQQLEGIAEYIKRVLSRSFRTVTDREGQCAGIKIDNEEVRAMLGYAEQLRIIAAEVKKLEPKK